MMTKQHQGKVIRKAIENAGLPFSNVAKKLGVSRGTLYNRFLQEELKTDFVFRVGRIIRCNIRKLLPEIEFHEEESKETEDESIELYIQSLKKRELLQNEFNKLFRCYRRALILIARLANESTNAQLKVEVETALKAELIASVEES